MREDYGQLWNMGRAGCWSWEVEEEGEREGIKWDTVAMACDACKERQGNNAAASAGRSRRTKPPHCNPSHEPGRMHTDVHTILVTLLRS